MIKIQLTDDEKKRLEALKRTRSAQSERALYVLLSNSGLSIKQVAEKLSRHEHTIRSWLNRYVADGMKGLISKTPPGRPQIKGILVEDEIEKILVKTPREYGYQEEGWTVRIILDYLLKRQIEVKPDTVRRALQKRGWAYSRISTKLQCFTHAKAS